MVWSCRFEAALPLIVALAAVGACQRGPELAPAIDITIPTPPPSPLPSATSVAPTDVLPPTAVYRGHYKCPQGETELTLRIRAGGPSVEALFEFTHRPTGVHGVFAMEGPRTGSAMVVLIPVRWIEQPSDYLMVGLSGKLSEGGRRFSGQITHEGCGRFDLKRSTP